MALSTSLPRIWSTTKRALIGDTRTLRVIAIASVSIMALFTNFIAGRLFYRHRAQNRPGLARTLQAYDLPYFLSQALE
ncbi:MAG: hypothetical protein H7832_05095 [Magnetococcus sp. DMHC-6]